MMRPVRPTALRMPFAVLLFLLAFLFLLSLVAPPKPHVILIGWDGVSPELLGELLDSGRLPNVAHLVDSGVFDKLITHKFSQTRLVWPIIYTGYNPEHNGISVDLASHWEEFQISPEMREVPAIWEDVASAGGWAMVLAPYESYPAERENHVMEISDFALQTHDLTSAPQDAFSSNTFREWSISRIEWGNYNPWVTNTLDFVMTPTGYNRDFAGKADSNAIDPDRVLGDLNRKIRREIIGLTMMAQGGEFLGCDLIVIYFQGTDLIQHMYNDDLPLRYNTIGSKNIEAALQVYDAAVGRIMDAAEPGTTFCIVSDHGFDMDPYDHLTFRIRQCSRESTIQQTVDKAQYATINGKRLFIDIDVTGDYLLADLNDALTKKEKQSAINLLRQEPNLFPLGLGLSDDHSSGIRRELPSKYLEDAVPPVGIFVLSGPHTLVNQHLGVSTIYDVAPTLLYALNLNIPSDMDGEIKLNNFKQYWVGRNPEKLVARIPRKKNKKVVVRDNSQRLPELRGMGYINNNE